MSSGRKKALVLVFTVAVLTAVACAFLGGVNAQAISAELIGGWQPGPEVYHPSRVIVRFADVVTAEAAADSIQSLGYSLCRVADFKATAAFPNGARIGVVELPEGHAPDTAVDRLSVAPGILYAEKDFLHYRSQAPVIPNDTHFGRMWGLHNEDLAPGYKDPRMPGSPVDDADIDMPEAWAIHTGSSEVVVAVIDTGCYIYHPDLAANIWINPGEIPGNGIDDDGNGYIDDVYGWDFFNDDDTVWDPYQRDKYGSLNDNHGTHVAGTVGAMTDNAKGVAGINWNVKIMSLKFIGPEGGYTSDAVLALHYAAANGARVTTNSWGGGGYNQALKDAIEASGMLFIAAAGNSGVNNDIVPHYPSSYDCPNIIAVAASMQNDEPCDYPGWWGTNYGATSVDLFAPGGYILSTIPPDPPPGPSEPPKEAYGFSYGSSMATPHVTGVAALLIGKYPGLSQYPEATGWTPGDLTIRDVILDTVDKNPSFEEKAVTGGRLNAARALDRPLLPIISSVVAEPTIGPPPLTVLFGAIASAPVGYIADAWWDFGDGSEPVHEFDATHIYEEEGVYEATFHVVNDGGYERTASVAIYVTYAPEIGVSPKSFESALRWEETETQRLTIGNSGIGTLNYSIDVRIGGNTGLEGSFGYRPDGFGGPDGSGYVWIDSDHPAGPEFEWRDISEVGTDLDMGGNDGKIVDLPFAFPFYGKTWDNIMISSEGYLTFGRKISSTGRPIPTASLPNDLIAAFWCNLNPSIKTGRVYYYASEDVFIVQFQEVYQNFVISPAGGPYTFQIILTPDGLIRYNYLDMGSVTKIATVGIENSTGADGLQVVYRDDYVRDNLSVVFMPLWVSANPRAGAIEPGASQDVDITFSAHKLPHGLHEATLIVNSNDLRKPAIEIGTRLHVHALNPPVIESIAADPSVGDPPLEVKFSASAYDREGSIAGIEWDFGDGSRASGTLTPVHTYEREGIYSAELTIADNDGLSSSKSVVVTVKPAPKATVTPPSLDLAVRAHRTRSDIVTIANAGTADLVFTVNAVNVVETLGADSSEAQIPEGFGGPDRFTYIWQDSDEPGGPQYDWVDITEVGTKLTGMKNDDRVIVDLPWEFPFYGVRHQTISVGANGLLYFDVNKGYISYPAPIPSPNLPDGLIAAYWARLDPKNISDPKGGVYCYEDTENDRFVVEYHKLPMWLNSGSHTFQVILYPDGTIVYQYKELIYGRAGHAAESVIGIENHDGSEGLQVLFKQAGYLHDELAIRIQPTPWLSVSPASGVLAPGQSMNVDVSFDTTFIGSGELMGAVEIGTNDPRGRVVSVPVHVTVTPNKSPVISACGVNPKQGPVTTAFEFVAAASDRDGTIVDKYWEFGDGSSPVHEFVVHHTYSQEGVYTAKFHAIDNDGYKAASEVTVRVEELPSVSWSPSQVRIRAAEGESASGSLNLMNAGPGKLVFGTAQLTPNAVRQAGLDIGSASVGDVLTTWPCPAPVQFVWGIGVNQKTGEVLISDSKLRQTYVVSPTGVQTGKNWNMPWAVDWTADMAYDENHDLIWQVHPGGDYGIYGMDPDTGEVKMSITSGPWTSTSQRGLAYKPQDDTFYIGGLGGTVYHIQGPSWARPGQVIEQWSAALSLVGLAYHPRADVLAISTNANPSMVYLVDASSHSVISEFEHPAGLANTGVGIEFDADGSLWLGSRENNSVYLVETGLGLVSGWLSWAPKYGTIAAAESIDMEIIVDASNLEPGQYQEQVAIHTNDPECPEIAVPVYLSVSPRPTISEASAAPRVGEPPLEVQFHAEIGAYETPIISHTWDFGDGQSADSLDVAHTYTEAGVYKAVFTVIDELGGRDTRSFDIDVRMLPLATITPGEIEVTLPAESTAVADVILGNADGHAELEFSAEVRGAGGKAAKGIAIQPRQGAVAAGEACSLAVSIDSGKLGHPGDEVRGQLEIRTNDPINPVFNVSVTVRIQPGPVISQVKASPSIGEPPLEVAFSAQVKPGGSPISQVWWDFGDGSQPECASSCVHVYPDLGEYSAGIHAIDENGVESVQTVQVLVKWLPVLEVSPSAFDQTVPVGGQSQTYLSIANKGRAPMTFTVKAAPNLDDSVGREDAGGPDEFGYVWLDSAEAGGPSFDWIEISEVGRRVSLDDETGAMTLLPFEFPFYGDLKTQIGISSNGYLCFDAGTLRGYRTNTPIPDPRKPNDLIAVFWDDLNPGVGGDVYYFYDAAADQFIVEYKDVPDKAGTGSFTFQVILRPNGTIIYQYLSITGAATSATVGIENATGQDGLQLAYNEPYIEDCLAVALSPIGSLLTVNSGSGYLLPGSREDIVVTFGSARATSGVYSLHLRVTSDDPYQPGVIVPVTLKVNTSPVGDITAPARGEELHGVSEITWTAVDADDDADTLLIDLYWSREGGEWNEIAKGLANTGSRVWNTASVGLGGDAFRVRIVVTDPAGQAAEIISEPFTIINDAPTAAFTFSPLPATVTSPVEFVDESTDDGEIIAWHWEFGDGAESAERNPKHQYSAKGEFTVKLTVTDNGGLTGVCEKQIQVVNVAPTVKILRPETGETWARAKEIEYEAADADGDPLAIRLEYDYLGDTAGWQLIAENQENTGKYLWDISKLAKGGLYKARVVASDPDGGTAEAVSGEFTIIVLKHMVTAAPNPAKDSVTFYYDIESDAMIYVYDVAGRLVYSADLAAGTNAHEWNLTAGDRPLAAGLYLYAVVTADGARSEVGRLVIER